MNSINKHTLNFIQRSKKWPVGKNIQR